MSRPGLTKAQLMQKMARAKSKAKNPVNPLTGKPLSLPKSGEPTSMQGVASTQSLDTEPEPQPSQPEPTHAAPIQSLPTASASEENQRNVSGNTDAPHEISGFQIEFSPIIGNSLGAQTRRELSKTSRILRGESTNGIEDQASHSEYGTYNPDAHHTPAKDTPAREIKNSDADIDEPFKIEITGTWQKIPMVNMERFRNQVELQRLMKLDLWDGFLHLAFLVCTVTAVLMQFNASAAFVTNQSVQNQIDRALNTRANGITTNYQDMQNEQDVYDWLVGAYFPAVQSTDWLSKKHHKVKYALHKSCDLSYHGLLSCSQQSTPVWNASSNAYEVTWEDRTMIRKYNQIVGAVRLIQRRGEVKSCDDHPFLVASGSKAESMPCYSDSYNEASPIHASSTTLKAGLNSIQLYCKSTFCDIVDSKSLSLYPSILSRKMLNEVAVSRYTLGKCGAGKNRNEFASRWGNTRQVAAAIFLIGRSPETTPTTPFEDVDVDSIMRNTTVKQASGSWAYSTSEATLRLLKIAADSLQGFDTKESTLSAISQSFLWANDTASVRLAHQVRMECYNSSLNDLKQYLYSSFDFSKPRTDRSYATYLDPWMPDTVINDYIVNMQRHSWIDGNTREVIVTLPAYNPNTHTFSLSNVQFEFDIGGGIDSSSHTRVLRLAGYSNTVDIIRLIFEVIAVLFAIAHLVFEVKQLCRYRTDRDATVIALVAPSRKRFHQLLPHELLLKIRYDSGRVEVIRSVNLERYERESEVKQRSANMDDEMIIARAKALVRAVKAMEGAESTEQAAKINEEELPSSGTSAHVKSYIPDHVRKTLHASEKQLQAERSAAELHKSIDPHAEAQRSTDQVWSDVVAATPRRKNRKKDGGGVLCMSSPRKPSSDSVGIGEETYDEMMERIRNENADFAHKQKNSDELVELLPKKVVHVDDLLPGDRVQLVVPRRFVDACALYVHNVSNAIDLLIVLMILGMAILWVDLQTRVDSFTAVGLGGKPFDIFTDPQPLADMIKELENLIKSFAIYRMVAAFTILLMVCKTLKYGRQHPRVRMFLSMMQKGIVDLLYFLFVFVVMLIAFALSAHCINGGDVAAYATVLQSVRTCFNIVIGSRSIDDLVGESLIGVAFFYVYNIIMIWVLFTGFIAIVSDVYSKSKVHATSETYSMPVYTPLLRQLSTTSLSKIVDWCNHGLYIKRNPQKFVQIDYLEDCFKEVAGVDLPQSLVTLCVVDRNTSKLSEGEARMDKYLDVLEADPTGHALSQLMLSAMNDARHKTDKDLQKMYTKLDERFKAIAQPTQPLRPSRAVLGSGDVADLDEVSGALEAMEHSIEDSMHYMADLKDMVERENSATRSSIRTMMMEMQDTLASLKTMS